MNKILETKKLSAGYGALRVLHEIDFSIAEGERIAIVGLNGHGKTNHRYLFPDRCEQTFAPP